MHASPRMFALVLAGYLLTVGAVAQKGLVGQDAKDPELIRALDAASAAFLGAQRAAANGQMPAFSEALNNANLRWAECYGKYREWPTSDTAWRANFDAINAALLNAVNAVSPGNNLPAAKVQIDSAVSTIAGLRSRNGILDVVGATDKLNLSLQGLQTAIEGLQTRPITAADLAALKTSFGSFRDNYAVFVQAVLDVNAFGLDDGELDTLRKLVVVQNVGIDTVYNVLSAPNTPGLVTQWQSLRDQILAMLTDLQTKANIVPTAADAPAGQPLTQPEAGASQKDNGDPTVGAPPPGRPRLFPRLQR